MQRRELKIRLRDRKGPRRPKEWNDTGRKSPQKRPIASRRLDLRFRRTGWWRMQSSETGLQRRNREFSENSRPKQVLGAPTPASHRKFRCNSKAVAVSPRHFPVTPQNRRLKRDNRRFNAQYQASVRPNRQRSAQVGIALGEVAQAVAGSAPAFLWMIRKETLG